MSTTAANLVTVAEFEQMPEPKNGSRLELHHGEVVLVAPSKMRHSAAQDRLFQLLQRVFTEPQWHTRIEFAFQPAAEHEVWVADIGVTTLAKWRGVGDDEWFHEARNSWLRSSRHRIRPLK